MPSMSVGGAGRRTLVDPALAGLVRLRTAQLHGCSHCLDLRTREARALGEREERLYLLDVWRDAPCYTGRERAALAFCEDVATPVQGHSAPSVYGDLRSHFDAEGIAALTRLVVQATMDTVPARRRRPLPD